MEETFKMMKSVVEGYETTKSIEELIEEYKQNQNANILAYIFVKNYMLINKIASRYKLLDTQDIASFSLMELDNAMKKFDFNKQCGFITFFYNCFDNRLKMEVNKLMTKASVANYLVEDLPEYEEIVDNNFTFSSVNDYNLTKEQNELCNYLMDGYTIREIATMLKVSHTAIHNRIKKLRNIFNEQCLQLS